MSVFKLLFIKEIGFCLHYLILFYREMTSAINVTEVDTGQGTVLKIVMGVDGVTVAGTDHLHHVEGGG